MFAKNLALRVDIQHGVIEAPTACFDIALAHADSDVGIGDFGRAAQFVRGITGNGQKNKSKNSAYTSLSTSSSPEGTAPTQDVYVGTKDSGKAINRAPFSTRRGGSSSRALSIVASRLRNTGVACIAATLKGALLFSGIIMLFSGEVTQCYYLNR